MRTPSEQYQYFVHECLERLLYLCGVPVTSHSFRWNITTTLYTIMIFSSMAFTFNTILFESKTMSLCAGSIIGFILQAALKFMTFIWRSREIANKFEYLHRIYVQCETGLAVPPTREAHVLGTWQRYFMLMTKVFAVIVTVTTSTILVSSVFANVVLHVAGFPLPVMPPFIDVETTQGVALVWSSHIVMLFGSTFGIIGSDSMMVVLLLHVCPMSQILCIKMHSMAQQLSASFAVVCRPTEQNEATAVGRFLVNCIRLHQEFIRYMGDMTQMYYIIFGFEILSNFVSMCMVLFALMTVDWMPLYGIFLVFLWKTFILCAIGTIMESQTNNIRNAFSNFPYYVLSIADQRKLQLCVQMSQHPRVLIAGTVPINLALFVQIMKNVYTFTMILNTMFD